MIRIRDDQHAWEVIEEYREAHYLTKDQMSERLDISRMHYNRMNLAGAITADRVGFLNRVSDAIGQDILIDGGEDVNQ